MGYKSSITIATYKAADFSKLAGVSVQVYEESSNVSEVNVTIDETGWDHSNIDKSTYEATEPGRMKAYYSKVGYKNGCAKVIRDGDFTDPYGMKNFSFYVDILLVAEDPVSLPV